MRMTLKISSRSLAGVAPGTAVVVASLELAPEERNEVEAVGLSPGSTVTVLRRAPFGGPLHVRVDTGAELALGAALAERVILAGGAP